MNDLSDFAVRVVTEAGRLVKEKTAYSDIIHRKKGGEPVTSGDILVEKVIIESIAKSYPEHGFLSEERGKHQADADYVWILDPIDGTRYFANRLPIYAISLALQYHGRSILGVVYSPELNQIFRAEAGAGASLNENRIHCSPKKNLDEAYVCLEIPGKDLSPGEIDAALGRTKMLVEHAKRVRIIGVTSIGLCWCAMAGFDAYVNLRGSVNLWDFAAGELIIKEAGGKFSNTGERIIAAPPILHDKICTLLKL